MAATPSYGRHPAANRSLRPNPLAPAARSAEAEALNRLADSEILRTLRDLSEESRVAVYLADIEGCAYKKIAQIMGTRSGWPCPGCTGAGRLREKLAPYAPGHGLVPMTG
jgi:RNA polymerase sigma-70 factor (ECF subfamily)